MKMKMTVTLFGAAGEVTGSAYHVQTRQASALVDFGLFQGREMASSANRVPRQLDVAKLDAVVLTHAHLDHVGRLPLLVKRGWIACGHTPRRFPQGSTR